MASGKGRATTLFWGLAFAAAVACGGSVRQNDDPPGSGVSDNGASGGNGSTVEVPPPPIDHGPIVQAGRGGQGTRPVVDTTQAGGGAGGEGGSLGGGPQHPDECSGEGGAPTIYGNCVYHQDVVCSWQRVTLPEFAGGAGGGPCEEAASMVDPSGAPLGGAGGDWPGRNACSDYQVDPKPQIGDCVDRCCNFVEATTERRIGTCTIAGHCCVLLDVEDCGV